MVRWACSSAQSTGAATVFYLRRGLAYLLSSKTQTEAIEGMLRWSLAALKTWSLHLNGWDLFIPAVFPFIVGAATSVFAERNRMNRKLLKAHEEIEHLAKVAERERIARDLHDVLGHTLSVITLKSELAGKLMDRDPDRAGHEIREVEQISRQALSEVRDAIRGYRSKGAGGGTGASQMHSGNRRRRGSMRCGDHGEIPPCTKACCQWRSGKPSQMSCATRRLALAACAWRNKMVPAVWKLRTTAAAASTMKATDSAACASASRC